MEKMLHWWRIGFDSALTSSLLAHATQVTVIVCPLSSLQRITIRIRYFDRLYK